MVKKDVNEMIKKIEKEAEIKKNLLLEFNKQLEENGILILEEIDSNRIEVVKKLNIKEFIIEVAHSGLMEDLHSLKTLGNIEISLNTREIVNWNDKKKIKKGLKVKIK